MNAPTIQVARPPRNLAFRTSLAALGLSAVVAAASGIYLELTSINHRELAARLEKGKAADWVALQEFDEKHELSRYRGVCLRSLGRDTASIWLSAVDAAQRTSDPRNSDLALRNASESLRAWLACSPLDGAMWLRLGLVDMQRNGPVPDVVAMLRNSYWTTPNEMSVVNSRIGFASRLHQAGVDGVGTILEQDIRTMAAWGRLEDLQALIDGAPPKVAPLYAAALTLLPAERREKLSPAPE